MSNVKAVLKVVLYAEQVVVAESSDSLLWQRVLAAINGNPSMPGKASKDVPPLGDAGEDDAPDQKVGKTTKGPLEKFAGEIGVSAEEVQAACDPTSEEPYLILDHDAWEAFKTQLGDRGPFAVSPAAAAATLLALWFKYSNVQDNATQAQAQAALKTINVRDSNAARGVKRAEWLQPRAGGQIILNPAKITKARLFAKSFCSQNWAEWKSSK
ncbi:hypothetical protein [Rhodanobacter umsongensis]